MALVHSLLIAFVGGRLPLAAQEKSSSDKQAVDFQAFHVVAGAAG